MHFWNPDLLGYVSSRGLKMNWTGYTISSVVDPDTIQGRGTN